MNNIKTETFKSYYDIGEEGYIMNIDNFKINKIRIGEVRVCKLSNSEEYSYELLEDTEYGFINDKYSYKPFDIKYDGSYRTCSLNANDIFKSIDDIKLAIRNYVEERARINIHKKLDVVNPMINVAQHETKATVNYSIGDIVYMEDTFGPEIITGTISDYMLVKQQSENRLLYVVRKSNGNICHYSENEIFTSKDKIFNRRATAYFNKFKIQ